MSETAVEQPVETEEKAPKQTALEKVQEAFPAGTVVRFEKTDDKGRKGTVVEVVEKVGVPYLQIDIVFNPEKTKTVVTRPSSVRLWNDEDTAEEEAKEAERQAALAEKQRLADEAKAKKEAEKAAAEAGETVSENETVVAENAEQVVTTRRRRRK